jgi:hypothetical protein
MPGVLKAIYRDGEMLKWVDFYLSSDSATQAPVSASAVPLLVPLLNLYLVVSKAEYPWKVSMMSAKQLLGHVYS